jgi:hypothetical protein
MSVVRNDKLKKVKFGSTDMMVSEVRIPAVTPSHPTSS